jgi:hypothetical protein
LEVRCVFWCHSFLARLAHALVMPTRFDTYLLFFFGGGGGGGRSTRRAASPSRAALLAVAGSLSGHPEVVVGMVAAAAAAAACRKLAATPVAGISRTEIGGQRSTVASSRRADSPRMAALLTIGTIRSGWLRFWQWG